MPDQIRIAFADIPWSNLTPGAREKVIDCDGKRFRLLEITPEFVEEGWCVREHSGMVLEGEVEITDQSEIVVLKAGDGLRLAGGDDNGHRARALTSQVVLFLIESP